jgi:hypothetical protein
MNILTVIACHNEDCIRAEKLIDHIFALNQKEQKGNVLILFAPSTPQENRDKVRISAEVVFRNVTVLPVNPPKELKDKPEFIAHMVGAAAQYIAKNCKTPWLWLEPDCLPLSCDWMDKITAAYEASPMRYLGGHLKFGEAIGLSRIGIYPNDAARDFEQAISLRIPFEFYAVNMSAKSRLFQTTNIQTENDYGLLRADAVLAHSDKRGALVERLTKQALEFVKFTQGDPVAVTTGTVPRKPGRPPKAVSVATPVNNPVTTQATV